MLIASDLRLALDPVAFAAAMGLKLDPWQSNILEHSPRRGLWCCSRQSGKTTTASVLALHVAAFEANSTIVLVAPSQRQSAELLRTIRQMHGQVDGLPEMADSVLKVELRNGSRIMALPGDGAGKTIRGIAGVRLAIVDEAARVDDELFAAVRPMLATRTDGQLILLSTPAGKRGTFFTLWHNGDTAWTRVRVPASECPRISPEFLAEELKELGPARFSEEYELAFIDSDVAAFNTDLITAAFDDTVKPLWS